MKQIWEVVLGWRGLHSVHLQASLPSCFVTHESGLMVQKGCPSHSINIPARKKEKREEKRYILGVTHAHLQVSISHVGFILDDLSRIYFASE